MNSRFWLAESVAGSRKPTLPTEILCSNPSYESELGVVAPGLRLRIEHTGGTVMTSIHNLLGGRHVLTAAFGCTSLFVALFAGAPQSKAQEVNPDHFTATGVETFEGSTGQPARVLVKTKAQQ